ncbi:MAG: SprB repeat-containing protein, partial [Saprospiraceae bacterium]
ENYQNVTIDNNVFTPFGGSTTYRHITVNTKELSSSSGFYPPVIGATMTNNTFNGSGAAGGIGLAFYNHDNDSPVFNAFTLGTAGNENDFDGTIGTYIYLDGQSGPTAAPVTTMAPWAVNLDGQNNTYAGVLPAAMTFPQLFTLENKIDHKIDNQNLGFVTVKVLNAYVTDINAAQSAINNDYTRIRNAIDFVGNNWNVNLNGSFDWTESNAATSWSLGNDGVVSVNDDYSILVPANLNGVTFTAPIGLGSASISGPGDLAAVNLEGGLVFDGGDNQGWTLSNMTYSGLDLSIGMFNGAGGTDAFNNTTITNNIFNIPTDLNATVAPADVNQNIGLHYSFGTNQTISNNTFNIPGDGVSNGTNYSTSVGMQSNTSGGSVYEGLAITGNTINVQNAQSANPQVILGIWENGHAHTSNINVSGNQFLNLAGGNNPVTNLQRGFRVTSHSGAASTVTYSANTVNGANIGFQWIAGSNFAGNLPVVVTRNTVNGCNTGVLVQSDGLATLTENYVINSLGEGIQFAAPASTGSVNSNDLSGNVGFAINNQTVSNINGTCNWYGFTSAALVAAEINGPVTYIPYLISGTDTDAGTVGFQPVACAACTIIATASATPSSCPSNNNGQATANVTGNVGTVTYLWSNGQTTNPATGLVNGVYTVTVTDVNGCTATASATVTGDNMGPVHNIETALNYCTIQSAIDAVATLNGHHITIDPGTYDEQVLVYKSLTITGVGMTQPIVDFTGTVTGKPTLFDVSADGVTIDNIHFKVKMATVRSAIIASSTGLDLITIKNNVIDPYGTPGGP